VAERAIAGRGGSSVGWPDEAAFQERRDDGFSERPGRRDALGRLSADPRVTRWLILAGALIYLVAIFVWAGLRVWSHFGEPGPRAARLLEVVRDNALPLGPPFALWLNGGYWLRWFAGALLALFAVTLAWRLLAWRRRRLLRA
jgi:hypothetical protein